MVGSQQNRSTFAAQIWPPGTLKHRLIQGGKQRGATPTPSAARGHRTTTRQLGHHAANAAPNRRLAATAAAATASATATAGPTAAAAKRCPSLVVGNG
jgi:hypothetical protein